MKRHPAIPAIWLVSDARNDARLAAALRKLPRGSGLIFRHRHLPPPQRRARWIALRRLAKGRGHLVVLAGTAAQARAWHADGAYGTPAELARGPRILRLATAHSLHELLAARRTRADAVLISPVHPTRSHPGAAALGPCRFGALACHANLPVIALGGMTAARARALKTAHWAAIDGIYPPRPA